MEIINSVALMAVLLQTSYLVYRQLSKKRLSGQGILLDTSVLIDGRILAIARSGLLTAQLIVPRSVVRELQFMADRADHDKRERARFGLEIIEKLQQVPSLTLHVTHDGDTSEHGVDEQLILLAQRTGAKLCTIDYNLNKAARVQSVDVVNINELAHALRVVHLPGEVVSVELVQPGQDKKQAVGYLDDGTMVVVDDSRDYIGTTVDVEITRALQTAAGRMMFAKRRLAKGSHDLSHRVKPPRTAGLRVHTENSAQKNSPTAHTNTATDKEVDVDRVKSASTARRTNGVNKAHPSGTKSVRPRRRSPEDSMVDLANQ